MAHMLFTLIRSSISVLVTLEAVGAAVTQLVEHSSMNRISVIDAPSVGGYYVWDQT